jgi:hypothetical protein
MLTKFDDPRIDEQFREMWQALDQPIQQALDKKIAFITDNDRWIPKRIPKEFFTNPAKDPAYPIDSKYIGAVDLYTVFLRDGILLLEDAELRRTLALELAQVYNDGEKWVDEVRDALEGRVPLDPWIPEVLGEARDVNEFWTWLNETVAFEAEIKVREWGAGHERRKLFVSVDSRLAERIEEGKPGVLGDESPIPIPAEIELLFRKVDLQAA